MNEPLHIVGITRFSIVTDETLTNFDKTERVTYDAAFRRVYSRERMERRFALFEAFALPSMDAIASRHLQFVYLLVISREMPDGFQHRLRTLVTGRHWIRLLEIERTQSFNDRLQEAVAEIVGGDRVFTFRFDDDDGLCERYADEVLEQAASVPDGAALSFNSGLSLQRGWGKRYGVTGMEKLNVACGLGFFTRGPNPRTIYSLGDHTKIGDQVPVVHVRGEPNWLRTLHGMNDSGRRRQFEPLSADRAKRRLAACFSHLDLDRVLQVI